MDFKKAIYATLAYSDIFDYPLTKEELLRYLLVTRSASSRFDTMVLSLPKVKKKEGYFYLSGRSSIIDLRKKRAAISLEKMKRAKKVVRILKRIPSIEFIGMSGSLAMANGDEDADIDLFLITRPQTLWLTRLLVLLFLEVKGMRRKRTGNTFSDTICVNMLVDTNHLRFPKERHDAYTAHELVQLKPLFERSNSYRRFLVANEWVLKYLPNGFVCMQSKEFHKETSLSFFLAPLEFLAQSVQIWYMKGHRTKETITDGFVAFHPFDYKKEILGQWEKKKKLYGI